MPRRFHFGREEFRGKSIANPVPSVVEVTVFGNNHLGSDGLNVVAWLLGGGLYTGSTAELEAMTLWFHGGTLKDARLALYSSASATPSSVNLEEDLGTVTVTGFNQPFSLGFSGAELEPGKYYWPGIKSSPSPGFIQIAMDPKPTGDWTEGFRAISGGNNEASTFAVAPLVQGGIGTFVGSVYLTYTL